MATAILNEDTEMLAEIASVAKGKSKDKDPSPDDTVKTLFAVKGSTVWNDWLKRFADSLGTTSLGAIDQCLRDKAEERGFESMPKRMPRKP